MDSKPAALWEVHLRIPDHGPVALSCKRGGELLTQSVARASNPAEALHMLEGLLQHFRRGDQLFVTARAHDAELSMWHTHSKAAGMYWCASALAKLWRQASASPPTLERRAPAESLRQRREAAQGCPGDRP